ncbi:hypothetical protein [Nocardioides sp. BYT-33-1]|uniref:hypothetical protein n=1 Tax=Nocardioides sp. BYT-33-1 TaxID=3416952 RepID=UPI003F52ECAA
MTTELVNEVTGEIVETIGADEARRLTTEAQNEFRSSAEHFNRAWSLIEQAVEGGGHIVLGYRSPGDYLHAEFDGVLSGLDVSARRIAVKTMTEWGLSTRAIAKPLGVSKTTIERDIHQVAHVGQVDPTFTSATDALAEINKTSQDAPETPLAENGISEPAEATEAEGPEPALSLSQVITGEAAGEVPAVDDPGDAIQPERGADLASPPAPSNVVGIDGKTYKRPTPKASRRSPLTDSFWRTVHEARKKVESLHRLVEDDRWPQNAEKVAAAHRNDLLRINDLLQQVINSLPAEESTQ